MKLKIFFLFTIILYWFGFCAAFSQDYDININFTNDASTNSPAFWPYQTTFFYFHKNLIGNVYDQKQLGISLPPDTDTLLINKNKLIEAHNIYDIHRILDDLSMSMDNNEKIELATSLGQSFRKNYDNSRADLGSGNGDIVSLEDLLAGLRNDKPAGVCRDIAVGQAQILSRLGSHNAYVLRFQTLGSGHASVVTQIPDNNSTLYKINYDELTTDSYNLGIEKLHQNTTIPDIGIHYHLYNQDGKPVAKLPSKLGQFLNIASGGSAQKLDPFLPSYPSLMSLNIIKGPVSGRIFCGITKNKEEIVGFAMNKNLAPKDNIFHLQLQSATSQYQSERTYVKVRANLMYTRIYGKLETPSLQIGKFFIQGSTGLDITALIGRGIIDYKGAMNYNYKEALKKDSVEDYGLSGLSHLESLWISENQKTSIKTNLLANFYADLYADNNDIRQQKEDLNDITLVHNYTLFHNELSYAVSSKIKSMCNVSYIYLQVGTLKEIGLGIERNQQRIIIGQTFPSSNLPNWVENSRERIYALFQQNINENNRLDFRIENIENDPKASVFNSWFSISVLFP